MVLIVHGFPSDLAALKVNEMFFLGWGWDGGGGGSLRSKLPPLFLFSLSKVFVFEAPPIKQFRPLFGELEKFPLVLSAWHLILRYFVQSCVFSNSHCSLSKWCLKLQ